MADIVIRRATAAESPVLQALWTTVFGDAPSLVQVFFEYFPPEEAGWVVSRGTEICSAAYLLTGNRLVCKNHTYPCAYVYAVATPASQRGNGYASCLMRHFAQWAVNADYALYTRPAEPGLYAWYHAVMDASTIGMGSETIIQRDRQSASPPLRIHAVEPLEYGRLRETYLSDMAHVVLSDAFLKLQDVYCRAAGGSFLKLGDGCCAVEIAESTLLIKELFVPNAQYNAAVQSLLQHFSLDTAIVRQQAHPGARQPFAACRPSFSAPETPVNWGLFLD